MDELAAGPLFRFADWPNERVPRRAAGVYTVWRGNDFIYAGMSGRGAQHEDFVAAPGQSAAPKGLWTQLNSHASGRRAGDQFNVYICDRFIVPALTQGQQHDIGAGRLLLDQMTRNFIREHLSYRFTIHHDGAQALAVERAVRAGNLPAGPPYLRDSVGLPARRPARRPRTLARDRSIVCDAIGICAHRPPYAVGCAEQWHSPVQCWSRRAPRAAAPRLPDRTRRHSRPWRPALTGASCQ